MTDQGLKRELGIGAAILLGLGSIVGTGVFVSIGIAAGITGSSVIFAVMIGALVASFNGLSSAQLAANHAVSGGTYEYAYKYLNPLLGFLAGWMFLLAKSASAATAALGFAAYIIHAFDLPEVWQIPLALVLVGLLTWVVWAGIKRSSLSNTVIVSITFLALLSLIVAATPRTLSNLSAALPLRFEGGWYGFLYASALMFVAYTGYGRIATLGEEVKEPRRTIPKAIILSLLISMVLYMAVAWVSVMTLGASALGSVQAGAAPLERVALVLNLPLLPQILLLGAVTAMLGVLLNLILGLSRVLLAMARRGDMPRQLAKLDKDSPRRAVLTMGMVIALLVLIGNVKTTWSFSAFTVLIYYAITNLAALRLSSVQRLFPLWISVAGLLSCLGLAVFVDLRVLVAGLFILLVIAAGFGLLQKRRG